MKGRKGFLVGLLGGPWAVAVIIAAAFGLLLTLVLGIPYLIGQIGRMGLQFVGIILLSIYFFGLVKGLKIHYSVLVAGAALLLLPYIPIIGPAVKGATLSSVWSAR